ncbi:hypothetical protein OGAPHI_002832 [Ogataea philodendri]|uniref:Uncharacterized protein n=1 Tax=Ogataea philodendri TaxID=1378263 RepID=A0A9P8P7X4_9ASCO|nr:uncharacterized protein OGAPHI_002832 [Ogataea philodendri]KAH3667183.1 hypothetical protein OGAPHI_002832 [Ogataea philodendri]
MWLRSPISTSVTIAVWPLKYLINELSCKERCMLSSTPAETRNWPEASKSRDVIGVSGTWLLKILDGLSDKSRFPDNGVAMVRNIRKRQLFGAQPQYIGGFLFWNLKTKLN